MKLIVEKITEDDYKNHRKDFINKTLKSFVDDYEDTLKKGITREELFTLLDEFINSLPWSVHNYIGGEKFRDWAIDILKNTLPDKITPSTPETTTLTKQYVIHNFEQDFVVPQGIEIIGEFAFSETDVKSVSIPNSVTNIGSYAFERCRNLTKINIPNSVESIESYAFCGCRNLTSLTIGDSVTSIEDDAFYDCSSLTSVTIPGSVTNIGESAFYNCRSLKNVIIQQGVTSIGRWMFRDCDSLTSIVIPGTVIKIGNYAFEDCKELTSISIPSSVTTIGDSTFYRCNKLKEFIYEGTEEQFKKYFKDLELPYGCEIICKGE